MIPLDLVKAIKKSPLNVQVHRAGDAEQGPRLIGRTSIDLGDNFIEAIILASSPSVLPVSAFIDGPYPLKNVFGEITATVYLYVRISCFGNSIFTQFKLKEGEKDYLFKMTGRKMDAAERATERLKCGKKSEEYLPKLSPIFTKVEDFTVGAKAPVLLSVEPKLKVPISWHKSGTKAPAIKICAPEKMYQKPPTRPKYRKTFTIEQQILQRVIPGFGRQAGDPDFIKNNPTLPRYCELKKNEADIGDGSTKPTGEIQEDSVKIEESSSETPGAKFPCQYGTSWKPVSFPLPREELYPKLKTLFRTPPTPMQSLADDESILQDDDIYSVQNHEQQMELSGGKPEVYLKCTCMKISRSLNQSHVGCECANTIKSKYLEPPEEAKRGYDVPNVRLEEYKPVEDKVRVTDCLEKKFPIPPEDSDKMIFMLKVDDNHFEDTEKRRRKGKQKVYKVTIKGDCFGECFGDCFDKNWTNLTFCKQIQKIAQKNLDKLKPEDKKKIDLKEIKVKEIHEKTGCTNVDCKCSCKTGRTKVSREEKGKEGVGKRGNSDEERDKRGETNEEKSRSKTEREGRKAKANEKLITKEVAEEKPAKEAIKSKGVAGKPGKDSKSNVDQTPAHASLAKRSLGKKEKKRKEKSADKEKSATLDDFKDILSARGKLLDTASDGKQPNLKEKCKKGIKYIFTSGKYPGILVGHQTCIPSVQLTTGGIQERCKGLYHEVELLSLYYYC